MLLGLKDSPMKLAIEKSFWDRVLVDPHFGKIYQITRYLYIENRLQVHMKYNMIDRFYMDIISTRPFIQQIADGYKSLPSDFERAEPIDHMK